MDWQAVLPFVVAGVVGAAVIWALCALLPTSWSAARWPLTIVAAVVFGLLGPRLIPAFAPSVAEVERQLLEGDPLFATWKETDPRSFAIYVADVRAAYVGDDRENALGRARAAVANEARVRLPNLDDAALVEHLLIQRDIFLDLRAEGPEFCRAIYFSESLPSSDVPVNATLAQRQQDVLARAFRAPSASGPILESEVYALALDEVLQSTSNVVGDDISLLSPTTPVAGRDIQFCAAAAEMFNQLALSAQAGPLYRTMLVQASQ
jgi:hypothetical protein